MLQLAIAYLLQQTATREIQTRTRGRGKKKMRRSLLVLIRPVSCTNRSEAGCTALNIMPCLLVFPVAR